jgi:hypothetical protein
MVIDFLNIGGICSENIIYIYPFYSWAHPFNGLSEIIRFC